ncbi:MAG: hypothetical protein QM638_14585 [Nocardioides sp.]|uniref:hypothetical protein n=1 Tax=Nocardioides sp. TaxID=35761 RepID=UPI0039E2D555
MYGEGEVIRRRVTQLREQATDLRGAADRLVARAEAVPWHGRAAEAMRARITERAVVLRAVAERHETAAEALARHEHEVASRKELIEETEKRAESLRAEGGLSDVTAPPPGHRDWLEVELG